MARSAYQQQRSTLAFSLADNAPHIRINRAQREKSLIAVMPHAASAAASAATRRWRQRKQSLARRRIENLVKNGKTPGRIKSRSGVA